MEPKIGDKFVVPASVNSWWAGVGEVVHLFRNNANIIDSVELKMLYGNEKDASGAFDIDRLIPLPEELPAKPAPAPKSPADVFVEQLHALPNGRYIVSKTEDGLTVGEAPALVEKHIDSLIQVLSENIIKADTGGVQGREDRDQAVASGVLALLILAATKS